MSVKAMALVWDFECPKRLGDMTFKPNHKYTLIAYADHADHNGKNIWPAVATVARKTGYEPRTIIRLTAELEEMGLLIPDGVGPRGTNKFRLPFDAGGDKLSPLTKYHPDKSAESLGDISSGDISSGDNLSPELKEQNNKIFNNEWTRILEQLKTDMPRAAFDTYFADTILLSMGDDLMVIGARNENVAAWLKDRMTRTVERLLVGILGKPMSVEFVIT